MLTDAERATLVRKLQDMTEQIQNTASLIRSSEPEMETLAMLDAVIMNLSRVVKRLSRVKTAHA